MAIGGVTGVFGKVSGVLGDTAARLTFDPEYQEERRRSGGKKTLTGTIGQGAEGVAKVGYSSVRWFFKSLHVYTGEVILCSFG